MQKSRHSILVRHQLFSEIVFGPLSLNPLGFRGYIYIMPRFRHLSPGNITLIRSHEIARRRRDPIEVASERDRKQVTRSVISRSRQILSEYHHSLTTRAIGRYTKKGMPKKKIEQRQENVQKIKKQQRERERERKKRKTEQETL